MAKEVRYLGVRLGEKGICPNSERVKPVLEANAPTNQRELREFLGAVTFSVLQQVFGKSVEDGETTK